MVPRSFSLVPENALVGFTGFVGSNLATQFKFHALFNSSNINTIAGRSFDLLVFAGAQSKKWWANQNPDADWVGIKKAIDPLMSVSTAKAVLISTIDVLPPTNPNADERLGCRSGNEVGYGANRLRLEEAFRTRFPNALIIRLPALFGPGLKKNVIFDLLHNNGIEKINRTSTFQYYDVKRLRADIDIAMRENLRLVHLFTEPVGTREIIERFFPKSDVGRDAAPEAHYDFRTHYGRLFGGNDKYIELHSSVIERLGEFVHAETSQVSR
jgi:hypothetical protein